MGKTFKDSGEICGKKREKVEKPRGPKPDYKPKAAAKEAKVYAGFQNHCDLFHAVEDNYIYKFGDLEFVKELHPRFNGSSDLIICVVCHSVPKDSSFERNGLRAGTRIPQFHLWKDGFVCKVKDEAVRGGVQTLYEFLRPHAPTVTAPINRNPIALKEQEEPANDKIVVPDETEPSVVSRILLGSIDRVGLVKVGEAIFRVEKHREKKFTIIFTHSAPAKLGLINEDNHDLFLPANSLHKREFKSTIANEKAASVQENMWSYIRNFLMEELKEEKVMPACISPVQILSKGGYGYLDLSDRTGQCIVKFSKSEKDGHAARVEAIGDNNILTISGVKVGTSANVESIMTGKPVGVQSSEEVSAKTALINAIRLKMEAGGVKLKKPAFKLVKAA